ncbi:MAG TPA: polysaccharide biosynthesis/export family protein [Vicinamibacterales bacterium]|nr:polysaccharide biosynthesis/export family protein [Vicinamibacterales bacterium]
MKALFSSRFVVMCAAVFSLLAGATAVRAQDAADYVIGPQDVLTINVFDQADLGGKYTVETDGTFTFPLIGRIRAGGLTIRAFEASLRQALAAGYFKNPQVTVSVDQYRSQRVFVMGEVRSPGPVPLTGGMTLIEALARAGSTLPTAAGELSIVRAPQGATGPVLPDQAATADVVHVSLKDLEGGSASQGIELHDGDTLFVPRADTAYVFGQVKNPGAFALQSDTTVLQALSMAGGVTENGAMNRIRIVRLENGEKQEIKVKLTDLVKPGDTIIVPERYF